MDNKKIALIIIIIILFLSIVTIYFLNFNSYSSIKKYVINNKEKLYNLVQQYMANEDVKNPSNIKSIQIFGLKNLIVQFDMWSPLKQYCGFYYSTNDVPAAFQNDEVMLTQVGDNIWEWKSTGDNKGKTIKICDNWYYFEATL